MTPAREAFVLPLIFLTVLLLGGLRIAASTLLLPPSIFALVLGILLIRLLFQSGALAPERLLSPSRRTLANVNGVIVLVALLGAAAQTFALLIPDSGLPRIAFNVFFLLLMVNTAAADPDRLRLLRSLAVTFGAAFVLKFVVLAELSAPGTGRLKRVLQVMLEGITLGTLTQEVQHPVTGYVGFLTLGLFLVGIYLLPHRQSPSRTLRLPASTA
jgi:hypothetical protein